MEARQNRIESMTKQCASQQSIISIARREYVTLPSTITCVSSVLGTLGGMDDERFYPKIPIPDSKTLLTFLAR